MGVPGFDTAPIEHSIALLRASGVPFEFRTTVVAQLHDEGSIRDMAEWVGSLVPGVKAKRFFLQSFTDRETVLYSGLSAPAQDALNHYILCIAAVAEMAEIRGQ